MVASSHALFLHHYCYSANSKVWQDLIQQFCRRELSFSKDKLPAISDLAAWLFQLSKAEDDSYLAGIWRSQLPGSLLWYLDLPLPVKDNNFKKPDCHRAPSWSWVSLDSKHLEWLEMKSQKNIANVLGCSITQRSDDVFGEVVDGHLDIEAPVKRGWLVPKRSHPELFEIWDDDWRAELVDRRPASLKGCLGRTWLDTNEFSGPSEYSSVELSNRACACDCLRLTETVGMLVEPTLEQVKDSDENVYPKRRRIGVVTFKPEHAKQWWEDGSKGILRSM